MAKGSSVEARCVINSWIGDVQLGENSNVGIGSIIIGPTVIGCNTTISQNVFISGENRIHSGSTEGLVQGHFKIESVEIGDGVWIGAGSIILPGVKIGDGAIIAAGAVVTKTVKPFQTVAGIPATVISERS